MAFQFWLKDSGGVYEQVDDPIDVDSFTEKILIDEDIRLLTLSYDQTLTFNRTGWAILKSEKDLQLFCSQVDILIKKKCADDTGWKDFIEARIFISECTFRTPKCEVECNIRDVSWQAQINNNKKQGVVVTTELSKNGVAITPVTDLDIDTFNPNTGAAINGNQAFDVKEVLAMLVAFMTDDTVTFESTWYDNLPSTEKLCLMVGKVVRDPTLLGVEPPTISFQEIFTELNHQYNLFVVGDSTAATPTIRIEDEAFVRGAASGITIDEIRESELSVDVNKLFSNVKLGSMTFLKNEDSSVANVSLPYVSTNTFVIEDYQLEGICNIDKTLDLTNNYITDHNSIEDAIRNGNDDNDDAIFLIQYTPGAPNIATKTFYLGNQSGTPAFYNEVLRNAEALNRWSLPNNVIKFVGGEDDSCEIRRDTSPSFNWTFAAQGPLLLEPVEYDFEVSDVNGNFNNTGVGLDAYSYTAPELGNYSFLIRLSMINIAYVGAPSIEQFRLYMTRYNAAGVLQQTYDTPPIDVFDNTGAGEPTFIDTFANNGTIPLKSFVDAGTDDVQFRANFFNIFMEATDFIHVLFRYNAPIGIGETLDFDLGSLETDEGADLFICVSPNSGGGLIEENDPADYIVNEHSFEKEMSDDDWDTLRENPTQSLDFVIDDVPFITVGDENTANVIRTGFTGSIERVLKNGETTFNLKTTS